MHSTVVDRIERQQNELDETAGTKGKIRSKPAAVTAACAEIRALPSPSTHGRETSNGAAFAEAPWAP